MNLFTSLKAATRNLPAVIPNATNAMTARLTGINRFGLSGFAGLELFAPDNARLLDLGYGQNHYVFTIADWKAQRYAMAKPLVYEVKDKKKLQKYKGLTPHQKKDSYALRLKAIEELDDLNDPLIKLLRQPNPYQSHAEYAYEQSVLWDFGNDLNYGVRLENGVNKGQIREMYHLSPVAYAGKNPGVKGYGSFFDATGVNPEIDGRNVLHLRRYMPPLDQQQGRLWGMSKLSPARRLLTKSTNAIEAEAEIMQNRGAKTIIFPKGVQWTEEVSAATLDGTNEVRRKLKQAGAGGIAGVGVELGSIELSLTPVELDLMNSGKVSKEELCALWHVHVLSVFSSTQGSTFANLEEANKLSIRGGVLPDVYLRDEKYNEWLVPAYGENRFIESDTDVYPELQADKEEMMRWVKELGLSLNDRNELFGFARSPLPEMDIPLVPQGYSPITDFGAQPAPEDLNNDGSY